MDHWPLPRLFLDEQKPSTPVSTVTQLPLSTVHPSSAPGPKKPCQYAVWGTTSTEGLTRADGRYPTKTSEGSQTKARGKNRNIRVGPLALLLYSGALGELLKYSSGCRAQVLGANSRFLALSAAATHLAAFFYLDGRLVNDSIPQAYVSTLSVALTHIFSVAISTCLTTGMAQALWYHLRKKPLPLHTVDNLFKLLQNPFGILDLKIPFIAPFMVIFAVVLLAIRIAVIFPPGALVVALAQSEATRVYNLQAADYTHPPSYLTFSNLTSPANDEGLHTENGVWWTSLTLGLSSMSINFDVTPLTVPLQLYSASPCGANCSYEVNAAIPSLQCESGLSLDLVRHLYGTENIYGLDYDSFSSLNFSYLAVSHTEEEEIDGHMRRTLRFDVSFGAGSSPNYTCLTYSNRARLKLSWSPEGNSAAVLSRTREVFNASVLLDPLYSDTYLEADHASAEPQPANSSAPSFPTGFDCVNRAWDCETLSEFESYLQLLLPLSGWMSANPNATMALPIGTCNEPVHPEFLVEIERSEETFWNASVQKFLHMNLASTSLAKATIITQANTYQFDKRLNFFVPYGTSLGVSTVLLGLSIFFLHDNGFGGGTGFLHILCNTVTLNSGIRALALRSAGRDAAARPEGLLEEKVIFGMVRCEDGKSRPGLGAVADVISMREKTRP
ncbi:hypothetical protein H2200_011961 [Cladophialophora chaetospira]|uniref:Uncharacterized protein n=1 Tax=Cladophialophora chaetospira TaxID=386627 RepID=A0AA38WZ29_9EURO|nr:hypothetical protein H2200_011961 [Cladophialophora chaetospira]